MLVNVLDYMDNAAKKYPDKIAFVEGEKSITFEAFRRRVNKRATGILYLLHEKNLQHRPVVLMQQKGID